jgi:hypothetical protein
VRRCPLGQSATPHAPKQRIAAHRCTLTCQMSSPCGPSSGEPGVGLSGSESGGGAGIKWRDGWESFAQGLASTRAGTAKEAADG